MITISIAVLYEGALQSCEQGQIIAHCDTIHGCGTIQANTLIILYVIVVTSSAGQYQKFKWCTLWSNIMVLLIYLINIIVL